jgi:hypothetical protein
MVRPARRNRFRGGHTLQPTGSSVLLSVGEVELPVHLFHPLAQRLEVLWVADLCW